MGREFESQLHASCCYLNGSDNNVAGRVEMLVLAFEFTTGQH